MTHVIESSTIYTTGANLYGKVEVHRGQHGHIDRVTVQSIILKGLDSEPTSGEDLKTYARQLLTLSENLIDKEHRIQK